MSKKELPFGVNKDDCRWDYYRCSGNDGQHVNKTPVGVRCTHKASGAVGQSCDERSQHLNKRIAVERMCKTNEFEQWNKMEVAKRTGELDSIECEAAVFGKEFSPIPPAHREATTYIFGQIYEQVKNVLLTLWWGLYTVGPAIVTMFVAGYFHWDLLKQNSPSPIFLVIGYVVATIFVQVWIVRWVNIYKAIKKHGSLEAVKAIKEVERRL